MKTFEKHLHEEGTGVHPLRDILDSLTDEEIEDSVKNYAKDYATEAIKADRERIKQFAEVEQFYNCGCYHPCHCARVDSKSIDNTPIELK